MTSAAANTPQYAEGIESLLSRKSGEVILAGNADSVAVLYDAFLRHAKKSVVILTRNLPSDVFDRPSLILRVDTALREGLRVDIISQGEPEARRFVAAYDRWKERFANMRLSEGTGNAFVVGLQSGFAVMDESAYRFEPDRGNPYACMHNSKLSKHLANVFFRAQLELSS